MDPHSPNKLFATKYCFLMLGDNTSFFFFISLFFVSFFVILRFLQKLFYYHYIIIIFFNENYFYFFIFRDVPGCSRMFRHVPGFIDAQESSGIVIRIKFWENMLMKMTEKATPSKRRVRSDTQPRSQGSFLPALWSERERETLENAGHVVPEQNYFWGRSPLSHIFLSGLIATFTVIAIAR